jgi:hypothetical protein
MARTNPVTQIYTLHSAKSGIVWFARHAKKVFCEADMTASLSMVTLNTEVS